MGIISLSIAPPSNSKKAASTKCEVTTAFSFAVSSSSEPPLESSNAEPFFLFTLIHLLYFAQVSTSGLFICWVHSHSWEDTPMWDFARGLRDQLFDQFEWGVGRSPLRCNGSRHSFSLHKVATEAYLTKSSHQLADQNSLGLLGAKPDPRLQN